MNSSFLSKNLIKISLLSMLIFLLSVRPFYPVYIWIEDERGYKCKLDDGTFRSCWKWLDVNNTGVANCFYFDQDGYLLSDTITPDGNQVDDKGQWIVNGVVQEKVLVDEDKPKNEEEFRKLLDKKYGEFVVKCDLAANEYLSLLREDPELYIDTNEVQTKIIGLYRNEFRPWVEMICPYYGFSNDIGRAYINKADSYSYNKYKQVRDKINK